MLGSGMGAKFSRTDSSYGAQNQKQPDSRGNQGKELALCVQQKMKKALHYLTQKVILCGLKEFTQFTLRSS